jgi:hypothetical protein
MPTHVMRAYMRAKSFFYQLGKIWQLQCQTVGGFFLDFFLQKIKDVNPIYQTVGDAQYDGSMTLFGFS